MSDTDILARLSAAIHLESAAIAPQTSPLLEAAKEARDAIEALRDDVNWLKIQFRIGNDEIERLRAILSRDVDGKGEDWLYESSHKQS